MDCAIALTPKVPAPNNPSFAYDGVISSHSEGDWSSFFENADIGHCPIDTC